MCNTGKRDHRYPHGYSLVWDQKKADEKEQREWERKHKRGPFNWFAPVALALLMCGGQPDGRDDRDILIIDNSRRGGRWTRFARTPTPQGDPAMCGQKRYFGDDRIDDYKEHQRNLRDKQNKRGETGDGRPFPWSFRRLVARLPRLA